MVICGEIYQKSGDQGCILPKKCSYNVLSLADMDCRNAMTSGRGVRTEVNAGPWTGRFFPQAPTFRAFAMANDLEAKRPIQKPLRGEYSTTVDEKFRLLIPQDLRERLGESFAMALSEYGCIIAMPQDAFYEKWEEIQKAGSLNPARRKYSREFMRYAADDLSFDKQGRVVIPSYLRDKGGLSGEEKKKQVLLVGAGDVLEVWDPVEFESYMSDEDSYGGERQERMASAYREMLKGGSE